MKKQTYIFLAFLLMSGHTASAQTETKPDTAKYKDFIYADEMPTFPGEEEALVRFLHDNIKPPKAKLAPGTNPIAYASFTVTKTGEIKDIKILKSPGPEYDAEVIRVLQLMPRWNPGSYKGEIVPITYNLPIRFGNNQAEKKEKGKKKK